MNRFKIGKKFIGLNDPCFIVAEISANHGGQIKNALTIIRNAKKIGLDAIKIQTYTADTITLRSKKKDFLITKNSPWKKNNYLWNLYNRAHTPWDWHKKLFKEAKKNKIILFSSPFDETAVDLLEKLECPIYKIASPEINHVPLLKKVAQTKKPVFLSTGLAKVDDVYLAIRTLKKYGTKKIVLMKCTTDYPAKYDELNLITISDYNKKFGVIPGYSDHTKDYIAPIVSVALGAKVLEKHIKLKNQKSVDDFFSMNTKHFEKMIKEIRNTENSIGKISYDITKGSLKHYRGRRSIYVSQNILKGQKISLGNIKIVRPNFSLHPKYFSKILGKKVKKNLSKGSRIKLSFLKN